MTLPHAIHIPLPDPVPQIEAADIQWDFSIGTERVAIKAWLHPDAYEKLGETLAGLTGVGRIYKAVSAVDNRGWRSTPYELSFSSYEDSLWVRIGADGPIKSSPCSTPAEAASLVADLLNDRIANAVAQWKLARELLDGEAGDWRINDV